MPTGELVALQYLETNEIPELLESTLHMHSHPPTKKHHELYSHLTAINRSCESIATVLPYKLMVAINMPKAVGSWNRVTSSLYGS